MKGSLKKRGTYWYAIVDIKDSKGNRKQKWINTKCERKGDADKELRKILSQIDGGNFYSTKKISFCEFAYDWLNTIAKNKVEKNTFASYELMMNVHIMPYFEKRGHNISDIKPIHIQKYCQEKSSTISANTIRKHLAVLSGIFKYALKVGLVESNIVGRVELPKKTKFKGNYFTIEQLKDIINYVDGKPMQAVILISAYYGLRRSEVLGLKWSDIDFDNDMLYVSRSRVLAGSVIIDKVTKTEGSCRALPLMPIVKEFLNELKQTVEERKLEHGDDYVDSDYICCLKDGTPIKPNYVSQKFKEIVRKLNLPEGFRFHDLRHTVAYILLKNKKSMKEIQYWLGHNDITASMNIYAHLDSDMKNASANVLNGLLS